MKRFILDSERIQKAFEKINKKSANIEKVAKVKIAKEFIHKTINEIEEIVCQKRIEEKTVKISSELQKEDDKLEEQLLEVNKVIKKDHTKVVFIEPKKDLSISDPLNLS